jgi:predicted RNA-binding protein with PIN domain
VGNCVARLLIPTYKTPHGTATSRSGQAQATQSIPAAKEGQAENRAARSGQTQNEKASGATGSDGVDSMSRRSRFLIVDGHSVIFGWPELRKLHHRRSSVARESLVKQLRQYQDWMDVRVVVVFDGRGAQVSASSDPHDVQIFYSRKGQTADAIIERLVSKYASHFDLTVVTSDYLEQETASAFGAECISPEALREILREAEKTKTRYVS